MFNIIFDFDGTLFKTETVDVAAFNMALQSFGKKELSEKEILSYIGLPMDKISEKCLKTSDPEKIKKFSKKAIENELMLIPRHAAMYPFAIELLDKLNKKGHKLAICSNGSREYLLKLVEHFNLAPYFDVIWFKRYGFSKKRAAEIVFGKLKNARKTFFVGDRKEDIDVARKNGFLSIGMRHGFGNNEELKKADYIANDLEDVYQIMMETED